MSSLRVKTDLDPTSPIVTFNCRGEIDTDTFEKFEKALQEVVENGAVYLVIDLSNVSYMSSNGIGVLLGCRADLAERNGELILIGTPPAVQDALSGLGFNNLFSMATSKREALRMLGNA